MKWKRQVPLGPYFADFACFEHRLIAELDGGQHHERAEFDGRRTRYLENAGWRVLRFRNGWVFRNLDGVCRAILEATHRRPLTRDR